MNQKDQNGKRPAFLRKDAARISSEMSSWIESLIEYRFLVELGSYLARFGHEMEVMRSDVDRAGHDLVLEANGVLRHIQLKATVLGGKRSRVTLNTALASKPAGCVIWMHYDPVSFNITGWRWLGCPDGGCLPDVGGRRAKHTRSNALRVKAERENHRDVGIGQFTKLEGWSQVAERLFGVPDPNRVLAEMLLDQQSGSETLRDAPKPFKLSIDVIDMLDGPELAKRLGIADVDNWLHARRASAASTFSWTGTLAELWLMLHFEQANAVPDAPDKALLEKLASQVRSLSPA